MSTPEGYYQRLQSMQHDLRGPSLTLLRTIQMLRRDTIPPDQRMHFLYQAELLALKNRMRIEALFDETHRTTECTQLERLNLEQAICDHLPQLHDLLEIDALYHSSLTATLSFVPSHDKVWINGSSGHIQRILENLVFNSITAGALVVHIRLETHNTRAILTIQDDGPGFPLEVLQQQQISLYQDGSGLGLFGVRSNVAMLSGTVHFANTGEGACVTITLPQVE